MKFIVSYPRSGSNFVQNVIRKSGQLRIIDIYLYENQDDVFLFKTHSPSMDHLFKDIERCCGQRQEAFPPSEILLLWRDPRDTMISLFEWYRVKKEPDVKPEAFFLEYTKSRHMPGYLGNWKLSPCEAYKAFYHNWQEHSQSDTAITFHSIRYEDILAAPEPRFEEIFRFFDVPARVNPNSFKQKVSLVSNTDRPRGVAGVWAEAQGEQRVLVDLVETHLKEQIEALGYA